MPQDKLPEPGEFTRIFKRQHLGAQGAADAEKKASEISGIFPAADVPPVQAEPQMANLQSRAVLGSSTPEIAEPPRSALPAVTGEPGEFTQYFMGGLPAKPPSTNLNATQRVPPGVQRPNSPIISSRNLNGDGSNSGSFTGRFAPRREAPTPRGEKGGDSALRNPWAAPSPELNKPWQARDEAAHFDSKPPLMPTPPPKDEPGEYTAIFGHGNVPPPPRQSAVTPPPLAPIMSDSPSARTFPDVPVTPQPPKGPSEFTVVSKGRPGNPGSDSISPEASSAAGTPKMPVGVNFTPPNIQSMIPGTGGSPHMPSGSAAASPSGANVSSPAGGASVHAPTITPMGVPQIKAPAGGASRFSDQTKLILFFGALAILAVILVVVLAAIQKN